MDTNNNWKYRWNSINQIQRLETCHCISGWGLHLALTFFLISSVFVLQNSLTFITEFGFIILNEAFELPTQSFLILISIYIAFTTLTGMAREKEHGQTLILFFGPVDEIAYLLGKYLAGVLLYIYSFIIYFVAVLFISLVTNFNLPGNLLGIFVIGYLCVSGMISLSIFLASRSKSFRHSILQFIFIVFIFAMILIGNEILATITPGKYYDSLNFIKQIFIELDRFANWISPYSLTFNGFTALRLGQISQVFVSALVLVIESVTLMTFSILNLNRMGVRP